MVLIDGHVHLHACHPVDEVLDAAVANTARAKASMPVILWLVESHGEGAGTRLRQHDGRWTGGRVDEVTWEMRHGDARVVIITGRQVVTAEDLEVLLVGTQDAPADGQSLAATVEPWLERDTLVVIPWGFGKWTGSRGRLVERAYEAYASAGLRLGDTALRPRWLPRPALFGRSARDGRAVFLGSDPFPFADRLDAVAATGFFLPDVADAGALTWTDIRAEIAALEPPLRTFGGGLSTPTFLSLQARMQFRKRLGIGR